MSVFDNRRSLLDAFRRGDRDALEAVYRFGVHDVAALIRRGFRVPSANLVVPGVRDPEQQRDLLQEVFVRSFSNKARSAYDGVSPYRPYLLRIAKNLMIDELRKSAVRRPAVAEGGDAIAASDLDRAEWPQPEQELEWQAMRAATQAYCADLDQNLQELVRLRFEEELSQRDVAKLLGVTRRKVRTWEAEIRKGLRRHLTGAQAGGSAAGTAPGAAQIARRHV